ncbi:nucleoside deaminase [Terracoccus luteus]|uniref:tRNA-specific adenosine deaminase n=1 Tax=Terracoccus luteus TaxID=53356 RepID=A0A839PWP7_9MICO|nr:nucleoside deaminase [Terracoccus luteus]MBB2986416.1 tRNA(adenine34) deaminase [Terracoccus luteus]MCP2171995.1 tRNA(adenine34) deaminase [Terracoccus luteus]
MTLGARTPDETAYAVWLGEAFAQAQEALAGEDVPVGAVVVDADGDVVGRGRNARERLGDPTAHAEVVALRDAAASLGAWRLDGCTLVVTLEPCVMCAGAAMAARVSRVVFAAWDAKAGACGSVWDLTRDPLSLHRVEVVGGIRERESADLLGDFFAGRRLR